MWRGIHVHNKDVCWNFTFTDILEDMTKNQNVLDLAHSDSHLYTHLRATHLTNCEFQNRILKM